MRALRLLSLVALLASPAFSQVTPGTSPLTVPKGGTGKSTPSITTVNGISCTLNGSNCTITASAGTITPGTTGVASGIANGLLYDAAGTLGNLATANNGVLVTSGAGAPSISTTLPSGLSIGSPTLTGTVGGAGVIPSSVLANTAVSASSYGSSTSIPSFTVNASGQLTSAAGNAVVAPAGTLTGTTLPVGLTGSSLTSLGIIGTGTWQGTVVGLAFGGTNNTLTPSNGGIVWSDASKLNILAGTATPNQCLLSGTSSSPVWGSCAGGATVTNIAGNVGAFTLAAGVSNSTNQIQLNGNYTGFTNSNCTLAASVSVNILTVALKENSGADPSVTSPCYLNYRNATSTTGSTTLVPQTAALSITTNAVGATLGTFNSNTPFRFWVVVFNNGGTNVLGLINCTGSGHIFPLNEAVLQSSTAISASATSAGVFYTPNGTTIATKAFRILGYVEYGTGLATAGTYASGPTIIQTFGDGVMKPGDTVQRMFSTASSSGITGSTSYVPTVLSQNYTKTSSANSTRLSTSVTSLSGGAGAQVQIQFFRGNVACTTAIGSFAYTSNLSLNQTVSQSLEWLDIPASSGTASAQYTLCVSDPNGVNITFPYSTSAGNIILEEIMG